MNKLFSFLIVTLILIGCATNASNIKNKASLPSAPMIEHDEMLKMAKDMDQERVPAIYVVVISQPEIITAKPPRR